MQKESERENLLMSMELKIMRFMDRYSLGVQLHLLINFDAANDPDNIIIDFNESRIVDMSAIEALKKVIEKYKTYNKKVVLKHLSPDCIQLLDNASGFIEVNHYEDPSYKVMSK